MKNWTQEGLSVERNFKDTVFRMLLKDKKVLLHVYNAVNGTDYTDAEALEINTLENAVYLNMKNDVSFVFDFQLYLYEHQSTINPNMPLRDLFYLAKLYENMTKNENLYSSRPVRLPAPHFIVFYNGAKEQPEQQIYRLSDLFITKEPNSEIELKVVVININQGHNERLMSRCEELRGYQIFVEKIRCYNGSMPLEAAVERSIQECIDGDILREFLLKNRSEVLHMSIFELDQEKYDRCLRQEGYEEGLEKGLWDGIKNSVEMCAELGISKADTIAKIEQKFHIPRQEAEAAVQRYWIGAQADLGNTEKEDSSR